MPDSTGVAHDVITGFDGLLDRFELSFSITGVDAPVNSGSLSAAGFDGDLAQAVGSAALGAGHAVLFTAGAGDLAGHTFLVVDANGAAGYQSGEDMVIELAGASNLAAFGLSDFFMLSDFFIQ